MNGQNQWRYSRSIQQKRWKLFTGWVLKILIALLTVIPLLLGPNSIALVGGQVIPGVSDNVFGEDLISRDDSTRSAGIVFQGTLGSTSTKSSESEFAIITEQPVVTGDDIFVAVATDPNSNMVITIEDAAGNNYQQVGSTVINSGQIRTYLFVAYDVRSMPSGSAITITDSTAVTAKAAVAALFNGLADISTLDKTASSTGSSTSPSSGATSTTTQADELLIGLVGTEGPQGDTSGTWGDSFTLGPRAGTSGGTDDTNITISMGYRIVASTGAYTAGKTGITSRDWTALIATFKSDPNPTGPKIYTFGIPLEEFQIVPGGTSLVQSYEVVGVNLLGDITISAPEDFEISLSSDSGFGSELVLPESDGSVVSTPIYVRFSRDTEGTSSGNLVHVSTDATTKNVPLTGVSAPPNPIEFNILLGCPEDDSIIMNIIPDADAVFYVEYGVTSESYTDDTSSDPVTCDQDEACEFSLEGLAANTKYYYRIVYHQAGISEWNHDEEHSFMTQRPPESSFVFTIQSDSHLGQYGGQTADEYDLYELTLQNQAADNPDFIIDVGDTYAMDPSPLGTGMTLEEAMAAYYVERPFLGEITHSIPFFQVIGNHENEEGWNFDDVFDAPDQSLAVVGMTARKYYIPIPIPDGFYTGNTDVTTIGDNPYHEDYYAWEWGDVLFVVLDPFHYSMTWPNDPDLSDPNQTLGYGGEGQDGEESGDRWDWTLGIDQYLWFKNVLETSNAKYKFVFSHHVTGGSSPYGRGGISAAPYFEWGGKNLDGTDGWVEHRSSIDPRWDLPIHQLMVANGVDVYFHGHDHIYAREELDGIVYIEVPKPDDAGYDWEPYGYGFNEDLYPDAISILPNSGYMRVSVTPQNVTIAYVRSYLPGDGTNGEVADSVVIGPEDTGILGDVNGDMAVNSTDALIVLSGGVGIDISQFCPISCGDVNGDKVVNSTDALMILSYSIGLEVPVPIGTTGCPSTEATCAGCNP
jgi:hypothetical protein